MKKGLKIALVIMTIIALGLGGVSYYLFTQYTSEKETKLTYLDELDSYSRSVYVTIEDVKAGDILKEGKNVEKQNFSTALPKEFFISEDFLNKMALTDIATGTPVYKSMVSDKEIDSLTRTLELQTVTLPLTLTNGTYADVRILFPNGEDYIVLSKKRVSNLMLEDCTFTTELNEEEIERLSSAIIDTFVVTGTKMYLSTYVAPNVQPESVPTYLVRKETIDAMAINPNLANVSKCASTINSALRTQMEERLANLTEEQLTAVQKGHEIEDTANASALMGIERGDYVLDDVVTYETDTEEIEVSDFEEITE